MRIKIMGLAALLLTACGAEQRTDVEYLNFPGIENTPPISVAVRVGDTLYLSGFLAYDTATGGILEGGVQAEMRATL